MEKVCHKERTNLLKRNYESGKTRSPRKILRSNTLGQFLIIMLIGRNIYALPSSGDEISLILPALAEMLLNMNREAWNHT